jgi:putative hydrolase of the HAD superfamily
MKTPKMILFDYGYTLLYEQNFDFLRGERALAPYIVKNRNRMSPEQVNELANRLYAQIINARKFGVEIHER